MTNIPQDASGPNRRAPLPGAFDADLVFARRLRAVREAAGLTQRQLAEQMTGAGYRMHQTTIAKIEAGERPVPIGEATALAWAVGVGLLDLTTAPLDPDPDLAETQVECLRWQTTVNSRIAQVASTRNDLASAERGLAEAREALAEAVRRNAMIRDRIAAAGQREVTE